MSVPFFLFRRVLRAPQVAELAQPVLSVDQTVVLKLLVLLDLRTDSCLFVRLIHLAGAVFVADIGDHRDILPQIHQVLVIPCHGQTGLLLQVRLQVVCAHVQSLLSLVVIVVPDEEWNLILLLDLIDGHLLFALAVETVVEAVSKPWLVIAEPDDNGRFFHLAEVVEQLRHGLVGDLDQVQILLCLLFPGAIAGDLYLLRLDHALRQFVAGAEAVSLDSGGRILIPKRYLEEAGIKNDVRFIGVDNTIEVWNKQDAEALLGQPEALADCLEEMMNAPQECK